MAVFHDSFHKTILNDHNLLNNWDILFQKQNEALYVYQIILENHFKKGGVHAGVCDLHWIHHTYQYLHNRGLLYIQVWQWSANHMSH